MNVLSILKSVYNYNTDGYTGFSINEIDAMYSTDQLDMLLTETKTPSDLLPQKVYIKYFLKGSLSPQSLDQIWEDLFQLSDTLTKDDCLYIIYDGEPNDSLYSYMNYLFNHDGIFVVVYNIKRLQFNILEHSLIPKISILNEEEAKSLAQKFKINSMEKFPEISRYDPLALAVCLRPGQVCKLIRNSPTAMETIYYRVCV
jgi:DNA-directed RNA polymerase subunit H